MTKDDWGGLCRNIYDKKCILFIGPEFPLKINVGDNLVDTSFSEILANKVRELLKNNFNVPEPIRKNSLQKEFAQLAGDYIKYATPDRKISRNNLEEKIGEFLYDEVDNDLSAEDFEKLISSLPFTFIVNTNFSDFFYQRLISVNKDAEKDFYNFRGEYKELSLPYKNNLGTEFSPFIFNFFGSIDNPTSLVMSENELIEFVINLISRNPGLPKNIKSELADSDRYFLFIGFGIITRNWYFRILLQALESNNKGSMSYALECIDNIPDDQDPTIVFFRDDLKVSLYNYDQRTFIKELVDNFGQYRLKREKRNLGNLIADDAPKVFISYKSEDHSKAYEIYLRLRKNGINAYLDTERLKGNWKESLLDEITVVTDMYLLLVSFNLHKTGETEVFREIHSALDRAQRFAAISDFIFIGYIDNCEPVLAKPVELRSIHSYNLTEVENIDNVSREIKRTYERNRRKSAA